MKGQVVELNYKNPDEERILRWAEDGDGQKIIELADRMSLASTSIVPVGSQETPWAAFENTRAFFERLIARPPWRCK